MSGSQARIRQLRPDQDGNFHRSVLPGSYFVGAVRGALMDGWQAGDTLDLAARTAELVDVAPGQIAHVTLTAH